MRNSSIVSNPFALMVNPEVVVAAMERSDRLSSLRRCVFHPLDKKLMARTASDVDAFDDEIDAELTVGLDD